MKKELLIGLLNTTMMLLVTGQVNAQTTALDYAHGGTLTIRANNYIDSKGTDAFKVTDVLSNTLLPSDPDSSKISIPIRGNYIVSTSAYICTTGSNNYVWTSIQVNGKVINSNANRANECGGAVVHAALHLNKGDVITGFCSLNQGLPGSCQMSLALSGLPYQ